MILIVARYVKDWTDSMDGDNLVKVERRRQKDLLAQKTTGQSGFSTAIDFGILPAILRTHLVDKFGACPDLSQQSRRMESSKL